MRLVSQIILVVAAVFFYAGMIGCIVDSTHSDAAGRGMAMGFAAVLGAILWLLLVALTILGFRRGHRPGWLTAAAVILLPLSAVAAALGADLYVERQEWALAVVAALPPLLVLMALWPGAGAALAGLILVLSALPVALTGHETTPGAAREATRPAPEKVRLEQTAKVGREVREREAAAFATLGPDATLADLLPFLHSSAYAEQALISIQRLKTRQSDSIALLESKPLADLTDLWQFNIMPTRRMCETYGSALTAAINRVTKASSDYISAAIELEWQLPNIKWLVAAKCDLSGPLQRAEANILAVSDSSRLTNFAHTLADLRGLK
jgi:hypothetical protein